MEFQGKSLSAYNVDIQEGFVAENTEQAFGGKATSG